MQFFKQIKTKAFTLPIFQKKPDQVLQNQKEKNTENEGTKQNNRNNQQSAYLKQVNIKSLAKAIFSKFSEQSKMAPSTKLDNSNSNTDNRNYKLKQGKFWHVTPSQNISIKQQAVEQQSQGQNPQQIQISQLEAVQFVSNLSSSIITYQKQLKNRTNKARNQIFSNLQIEPIYMHENYTQKILKMELQHEKCQKIERTQALVIQSNNIDRAIENVLLSGYLWKAHNMQNFQFMSKCFEVLQENMKNVFIMQENVKQVRKSMHNFIQHFNKVSKLNKRRMITRNKIQLLKKIKSYQKDVKMTFQNIDQAFYIQRSRQKLFSNLFTSQLTRKIKIFQFFYQQIQQINTKLVQLLQHTLLQWIDNQLKLQSKHIQKLLIMLYFTRSQKMYLSNKLHVDLKKIKNKQKFMQQLTTVQEWKDYRYVNDNAVKMRVKQFLQQLIREIKYIIKKSQNNQNKSKKIQVTTINKSSQIKQKICKQVKF